jgi:eukaryotic translation initiation factor 2C
LYEKSAPDRIIVFRDGVGDGRLRYTRDMEIPQLEATFAAFGDDYRPKLTFVVVSKRINEKFVTFDRQTVRPG